jgi:hypothetical protein
MAPLEQQDYKALSEQLAAEAQEQLAILAQWVLRVRLVYRDQQD